MILTDEESLRIECTDVLESEVDSLREQLENELRESAKRGYPGVGLAAPQIGIPKKMAIIRTRDRAIDLVNAEIKDQYDSFLFENEGCLSFPGKTVNTRRYKSIHIVNNLVEPYNFIIHGFEAIVCQHELDHLNGILLIDREIKENIKKKVRPNDQCPCGSGKKYKRCCGKG